MPALTSPRYLNAINILAIRVMEFRIFCTIGLTANRANAALQGGGVDYYCPRVGFVHFVHVDVGAVRNWERSRAAGRSGLREPPASGTRVADVERRRQ